MIRRISLFAAAAALGLFALSAPAAFAAKPHHHKHHHHGKTTLVVTVVDHHGQPVAGTSVHLGAPAHHKHHKPHKVKNAAPGVHHTKHKHHHHHASGRHVVTNANGQATLHVRPGHHYVTAHKKGVGHGHHKVFLEANQRGGITIRLSHHHHGHGKKGKKHHHHARVVPVAPPRPLPRRRQWASSRRHANVVLIADSLCCRHPSRSHALRGNPAWPPLCGALPR